MYGRSSADVCQQLLECQEHAPACTVNTRIRVGLSPTTSPAVAAESDTRASPAEVSAATSVRATTRRMPWRAMLERVGRPSPGDGCRRRRRDPRWRAHGARQQPAAVHRRRAGKRTSDTARKKKRWGGRITCHAFQVWNSTEFQYNSLRGSFWLNYELFRTHPVEFSI